jgi:hypothetical protein
MLNERQTDVEQKWDGHRTKVGQMSNRNRMERCNEMNYNYDKLRQ